MLEAAMFHRKVGLSLSLTFFIPFYVASGSKSGSETSTASGT